MSSEIKGTASADLHALDTGSGKRAAGGANRAQEGPGGAPPSGSGARADQVNLTDTAALLRRIESTLAAEPVVDAARVSAVREALDSGSYAVDPQRVTESLLELERMLGPGEGKG